MLFRSEKKRKNVYDQILSRELSVRTTEEMVKHYDKYFKVVESKAKPLKMLEISAIEDDLSVLVGTKVTIKEKNGKGKIAIDFYDIEDLNRILDVLLK